MAVALDRLVDRPWLAVAHVLGPEPPVRASFPVGGRLEGGEAPQGFAARSCERVVVGDERIAGACGADAGEGRAPGFERGSLGAPYRVILDVRGRGRGCERRRERGERLVDRRVARQARAVERVDQYRIEEPAIGGIIGTGSVPVAREQHMERADAEIGRPGGAGLLAREREGREVADPLVRTVAVRTSQGVKLGGHAEPLALRRRGAEGFRRGDGQRAFERRQR